MIDVTFLRENPDLLRLALTRRGVEFSVDELSDLDRRRRDVRHAAEEIRSEQKQAGTAIAALQGEEKQTAIAHAASLSEAYKQLTVEADGLDEEFDAWWVQIPNIAHDSAPDGMTEDDAVEIKRWGVVPEFEFEVKDHQDLGETLDIIDIERGVKVSGSRFAYLKGKAVLLELGLVRFAMDRLTSEGFTPVAPPVLVREEALFGTGFFPADRDQVYAVERDDLFLVGTSEVSLAALHLDEILDGADLPVRYAGVSTCFRREAGTYGKDTAGIFRVHQFDKVEMFVFIAPDDSATEHDRLLAVEEKLVGELEVPYRVVNVAAGDLGAAAAKKYDIEAWFPGEQNYREITSCSNTTDFQARRLKVRMKTERGNQVVHTLNGTACAVGRTILALIENHQQADGSVVIPKALRPYTGFDLIEP
jgi:seryl-tRNA synthetase